MKTFNQIIKYANSRGIIVEKTGRKYECWNINNDSVVAVSYTLAELMHDIADLAGDFKS